MAASKPGTSAASNTADREIYALRVFEAPRDLVWKVWTEPHHIAKWWGPNGFTNTIQKMDVKPGGIWEFAMHGPDGTDYKNKIVYVEVVKPERIVYDHISYPAFRATALFEKLGEKTQVSMRMVFESAELREKVAKQFGAVEGLSQTLGKLGEHLAKTAVIVERTFDAPVATVWKAITDKDQMKQWFFETLDSFKAEVGFQTIVTVRHNEKVYPHVWNVVEVVPEKKLAFEWSYTNYQGNSLVTMELFEEKNKTRLRLTHDGLDTFPQDDPDFARTSFNAGWNALIGERLKEFLGKDSAAGS
jgi:uncharacterized protein YndB with AHSA1/START domain